VALLEKQAEVGFGTSKTNSGIIHPGHDTGLDTLKGRLVVRGNALYDDLAAELHFGFRRIGEINVAIEESDLPTLERMKKQGEAKGVPSLEMWDQDRLRREEPNLSPALLGALYTPSAGVINPYEFAFALIENAVRNGVALFVDSPVQSIVPDGDSIGVTTPRGTLQGRFVLNCTGVVSDQIEGLLGFHSFHIQPRKGEEYMLDKRLKGLVRRLVFPVPTPTTKGILIIPTFDGTLMVGPTAHDVEDREDFSTTTQGAEEIFSFVRRLCPAISPLDAITEFAGLRAVSDTNDFVIGPTRVKGFLNVAGIQSPGLTCAPSIAEYVCDMLRSEGLLLVEKSDFKVQIKGPARFALLGPEEQQALARENPLFAKVVCRCEGVTEAEVHEAIDHGARTFDGIKFRTRAGMGRCQGGFCTSRCMEILARRLSIPIHEVTKRGGKSWIVRPMTMPGEK
jgi:glycerol-3-phosphate dehydrogenase